MNYKIQRKKMREIVNSYDPENLIEGGAPEDEYDAYVDRIFSLAQKNCLTVDSLRQVFPAAPKKIEYTAFLNDLLQIFEQS